MAFADGKTPDEVARRNPAPSSHAARSVNARIQAGPIWMEIVQSDQLPKPIPVASPWERVLVWRRGVPTSRLIGVAALAAAALTAISLSTAPYRWPTLPDPAGGAIPAVFGGVHLPDPDPVTTPTSGSSSPSSVPAHELIKAPTAPRTSAPTPTPTPNHPVATPSASASSTPTSVAATSTASSAASSPSSAPTSPTDTPSTGSDPTSATPTPTDTNVVQQIVNVVTSP